MSIHSCGGRLEPGNPAHKREVTNNGDFERIFRWLQQGGKNTKNRWLSIAFSSISVGAALPTRWLKCNESNP
jgi:hypothetical protein